MVYRKGITRISKTVYNLDRTRPSVINKTNKVTLQSHCPSGITLQDKGIIQVDLNKTIVHRARPSSATGAKITLHPLGTTASILQPIPRTTKPPTANLKTPQYIQSRKINSRPKCAATSPTSPSQYVGTPSQFPKPSLTTSRRSTAPPSQTPSTTTTRNPTACLSNSQSPSPGPVPSRPRKTSRWRCSGYVRTVRRR